MLFDISDSSADVSGLPGTQQKFLSCSSRSAGHRGRSPGPHVLAAPQGRVAAAQVRMS